MGKIAGNWSEMTATEWEATQGERTRLAFDEVGLCRWRLPRGVTSEGGLPPVLIKWIALVQSASENRTSGNGSRS